MFMLRKALNHSSGAHRLGASTKASLLGLLLMAVPATSCGGDGTSESQGPAPAYEDPPELSPNDKGVYELHFKPAAVEIGGKRYCLRTYNGIVPGPTIRVPPGTDRRVHVQLYNEFTQSDYQEINGIDFVGRTTCHDFNLTNLHAHGAHVQPNYATADANDPCTGNGCGPLSAYYGDNVLNMVGPSETAQYRWDFDEDGPHHSGINWYHPHIHGSTAIQVINGASGALIIEGDLDQIPSIKKAKERVMVMNQVPIDSDYATPLKDGEECTEHNISANNFATVNELRPTLINGKLKPRMKTAPNQVERWRLVYAGTPDEVGIKVHKAKDENCSAFDLEPMEITQIARDGITLPQFYKSDTMWVSPGYRIEAMVKMPAEKQTLCMVGRRPADLLGSVIMMIDVDPSVGVPTSVDMPGEAEVTAVAPPTSWMGKVDGQMVTASCDSVKTIHQKVALLVPTPGEPPSKPPGEVVLKSCDPKDYVVEVDPNAPVCKCPAPNINCRNFEDRRAWGYRSDRVMEVGTTEKWDVRAFDGHPFHIHINPFLVCPNDSNKEPNFAHFRDTFWVQADDGPRQFLMNFRKFSGQFVLHCHKLNHEDDGMMELLEICAEGDTACLCQGTDANGNCISQAGCKAEDKQCQFAKEASDAFPAPPAPNPGLCGP